MSVLYVWEGVGALVPLYVCGGKETARESWVLLLTLCRSGDGTHGVRLSGKCFSRNSSSQPFFLSAVLTSQLLYRVIHFPVWSWPGSRKCGWQESNPMEVFCLTPVYNPSPQPFSPVLFLVSLGLERLSVCFTKWLLMVFLF